MLRRFNYTNRITIQKSDVSIAVREVSGAPPVATLGINLEQYELPEDAEVLVEAYRGASYMRERLGTVGALLPETEVPLRKFGTPDEVKFRVKVVRHGRSGEREGPLLLAAADALSPNGGGDEDEDVERLLSLQPADLNGEVWRVEVDEKPVLLLERSFWEDRMFVRSPWFFALVMPSLFREALRRALDDEYRELDEDTWQSRWLNFALTLPPDRNLPGQEDDEDQIQDWINQRVEAFARSQKIRDRFEPVIRGAD